MKIGVLACLYGNHDLLPQVLEPWFALKKEGVPLIIGGINVQFKEYADLGFPDDDDATRAALEGARQHFDMLEIISKPMSEKEARTHLLKKLLEKDVDLIWILDGDEVYTKEQVRNIISYVERTPFDYYHIYFDNRIFDTWQWRDNFAPPRMFRTNRHGGIQEFAWDNDLIFSDGTKAQSLVPGMVPKQLAYVLHHTWRKEEAEKKIAYHHKHFGYSMYRMNASGDLDIDPAYFLRHGMRTPERLPDGSFAPSPKQTLEVILRSHSTGNFRESIRRVTDELGGRAELTVRTLRSLINALLVLERANTIHIRLAILDDHSDTHSVKIMKKMLELCPFETEFVELELRGNGPSLEAAYERGRTGNADLVYFVEDDYLHEPTALLEMVLSHRVFTRNLGKKEVGLFPVDYRDRYIENITPSRVVIGSNRHWRTIISTTGTFFISRETLEEQWPYFILFSKNNAFEGTSINQVWQNHTIMFSPIPTLAYHLHGEEEMPPFTEWKKLWDSLAE